MIKFNERLRKIMSEKNISQAELSRLTGIRQSSLSGYMLGTYEPKQDKIGIIARALNVAPSYLMGWTDEPTLDEPNTITAGSSHADFNATVIELPESTMIPVYGSIAAGVALEAIQDISGYIDVPSEWIAQGKTVIGLKIKGDSMYPSYFEGDVVIIQCDTEYSSGDDCAVYINGYDATIKRIKLLEDGIELIPLNTSYPPKRYKPDEYSILGKVIELRRRI